MGPGARSTLRASRSVDAVSSVSTRPAIGGTHPSRPQRRAAAHDAAPLVPAVAIAQRLGLRSRLSGVYSLDTLTPPAPRKRDVVAHVLAEHQVPRGTAVMIGDSGDDADAAAANGLPFIAVTYGYGNPLGDPAVRPAAVLDRLADLPDLLVRLD